MASYAAIPRIKLLGLERAARLAGESFGYEEPGTFSASGSYSASRWLWSLVVLAALAGMIAVALR